MRSAIRMMVAAGLVTLGSWSGVAEAADITLYEVSEAVKLDAKKGGKFKSNAGTLTGWARAGSAVCPQFIVDALDKTTAATKVCLLSIDATGKADDITGVGPVEGKIAVLFQDKNDVDAPEIIVLTGKINGTINMSPAFQQARPLGSISGKYEIEGVSDTIAKGYKVAGTYTGTFRLPFVTQDLTTPQYLLDDGQTVAIQPAEYVLRYPAVRLEVNLTK